VREAGLTLKGKKCHVAMSAVHYLGHIFSGAGMSPDVQKIKAVQEWPIPTTVKEVRRFLGLASYYRRYILHFADISKPLNSLTQKDVSFKWSNECAHAFNELKSKLITAPILSYPQFHQNASQFVLQTDASAAGLGAVLEQDGHVIAYATSCSPGLYSTLQCLSNSLCQYLPLSPHFCQLPLQLRLTRP